MNEQFKMINFIDARTMEGAIVFAIIFLVFAWVLTRMMRLGVKRILARDSYIHIDRTRVLFLSQLGQISVYIITFFAYAHTIPALAGLGNLGLASVGALSVITGLAAQNTLSNLISGIALLIYRPFIVGDRLQVTAPTGFETAVVESLTLGYTLLRTDDNRRVVVPNSIMASQTTINLTRDDPRIVFSLSVTISHDADMDKARAIMMELGNQNAKALEVIGCPVTHIDAVGVTLTLSTWCSESTAAGSLRTELLEGVKRRFAAEGIRFPQVRAVVVKQ